MSRIVILRHGNTFSAGEPPRRIGARTDLSLTATGREQARAAAAALLPFRFDRILTGALARTRETAAIVASRLGLAASIATTDWLTEIDHGPDEDQAEGAVLARIGADALHAWDEHALPPPGWQVDAEARIAGWRALFALRDGDTLVVTSNGAARFALLALGARPTAGYKLRTGAWGLIEDGGLAGWDIRPDHIGI